MAASPPTDCQDKTMSEAGLAPSPVHAAARSRSPRVSRSQLNPVEALERGFALFRSTFVGEGWRYYAGSAPLIFCFIPMWVVNGQIRVTESVVLAEAVLLAGAYLLRVCMASSYMQRVRKRAFGAPTPEPAGATAQAAAAGRLIAWKITLATAALATLPSLAGPSWFYSACQFASLETGDDRLRHSMRGCLAIAGQWFGSSVLLLFMLFPLWIAVWLNGLIDCGIGSAASALNSWRQYSAVDTGGDNRAGPQFRFLAFVVRRDMAGS